MIHTDTTGADVASHYDELDPFYRRLWGEHVHHGLWETGRESPLEAVAQLSRHVAIRAEIKAGQRVCDVGCGYGATARLLAADYGARVTGITISPKQHAAAASAGGAEFVLGDWLENDFPTASLDAVIAIESTEHLPDVARGIAEMARVLVPGGRLVICAWMAGPAPRAWERRQLLEPICREGRLIGMGNEADYRRWLADAGLELQTVEDISRKVRRTWPICIRRTISAFFRDAELRRYLLDDHERNRIFAVTLVRIWIAYLTGALHYTVFTAMKPAGSAEFIPLGR
ncbi:methyltransferase domain-containing protein [Luteolibacter arcticus]|uniref:Methyltransferase domain-containing protein n=1 Tax=Luteolibacter arcticus TaxID=1581411 RepID=A0ABT3GM99_9BACT|nr:methyltransferase domain-containing protein [Luteolibacter arcticus]MCW1924596.1 methyltransferase domain-containing protein [Luteolibacter arcticus]